MKTKEVPLSLFTALRLKLTPAGRLGAGARRLETPVLVSFTSIPSRLHVLHLTVRSLLAQSVRPDGILLWLNETLEGRVPLPLARLVGERFQIRFRPGTSAHRKLVYPLREFPGHTVVTCDDDHMYPRDWLERLHDAHRAHPGEVVAHECRRIAYGADGRVRPYREWGGEEPGEAHRDTLAIGYGGTLYPPGALHPDVTDEALYLELAPRADDLWFKAMSLRAGTATRRSPHPPRKPVPILRSQEEALGDTNIHEDGNRTQWEALVGRYGVGPAGDDGAPS